VSNSIRNHGNEQGTRTQAKGNRETKLRVLLHQIFLCVLVVHLHNISALVAWKCKLLKMCRFWQHTSLLC